MLLPNEELHALLVQSKLIDEKTLTDILTFANNSGTSLEDAIVEQDVLTDERLGQLIADYFKVPFIDLSKITISEDIFRVVPERLARKYSIIPFERNDTGIKIAMG